VDYYEISGCGAEQFGRNVKVFRETLQCTPQDGDSMFLRNGGTYISQHTSQKIAIIIIIIM
jgi:hypothetical protein